MLGLWIGFVLFLILAVSLSDFIIVTVPAGHRGVMWRRFGGGTDLVSFKDEGTHFILPIDKVFIYDLRLQTLNSDIKVIIADGLTISVDYSVRFQINAPYTPYIHKFVGPNYPQSVVMVETGAALRDVLSTFKPEDLSGPRRRDVEETVRALLRDEIRLKMQIDETPVTGLLIEDVMVQNITLPETVQQAINRKNEQRHLAEEYQFRLVRERGEAERKYVEAWGIKTFQEIVRPSIDDSYLRWRGIEATMQLATSNNAKVVVIGSGDQGLPIILGNMDSPPAAAPAAAGSVKSDAGAAVAAPNTQAPGNPPAYLPPPPFAQVPALPPITGMPTGGAAQPPQN